MQFEVFTLLPEVFSPYLESSILQRARQRRLVSVNVHNIRDYTHDKHHMTDDTPYGGGGGMVMKPEPVFEAIEAVLGMDAYQIQSRNGAPLKPVCPIIMLTPQGRVFTQAIADELSRHEKIVLLCGRYEGMDERIREHLVTDEISIGDYVLTGGELPALTLIDAVSRLIPGVLGDPEGAIDNSHATGLLEYPHYTRPPDFRGWKVPEILLSGDHGKIEQWRREQSLLRTLARRPDLLEKAELTEKERKFLEAYKNQISKGDAE